MKCRVGFPSPGPALVESPRRGSERDSNPSRGFLPPRRTIANPAFSLGPVKEAPAGFSSIFPAGVFLPFSKTERR